ncbi:MAG: hypothetical protein ACLPX9_11650 [Rhodomicrobium sp.]
MATWTAGAIIDAQAQTPASKDFFGLVQNRGKPLEIEAALAEPEAGGAERYGGNGSWVRVRLGDTTVKSHFVAVYYERSPATIGISTAELRKAGLTHILKLEASGDVLLRYPDQTATGDKAVFDIRANKVWFEGNVSITHTKNAVRLFADLTTGKVLTWDLSDLTKGPYPPVFEKWEQPKVR